MNILLKPFRVLISFPIAWGFCLLGDLVEDYPEYRGIVDWLTMVSMYYQDWGDLYHPWKIIGDPYNRLHRRPDVI